ncbi:MAG: OsmC family protein [Bacteroidia bacterium]|nr:OsmC family protein [Bacteroidia bacterium]
MPTISTTYKGDLRCESTHIKSGNVLLTDAPTDNNGKGEAFSPTDTLAAALGTCMVTIMGIKARDLSVSIDGTAIDVTKIMEQNPRRVGEVVIEINVANSTLDDKQKQLLESAALNCPVAKSVHPNLIQTVRFNYP